jgi:hypothetical protein
VEFDVQVLQQFRQCIRLRTPFAVVHAGGDHHLDKAVDIPVPVEQPPVEPVDLVVLAVRVVIAALCAPHLIAHLDEWRADRREQ